MYLTMQYDINKENYLNFAKINLPFEAITRYTCGNEIYSKVEIDMGIGGSIDYLQRSFDNVKMFNRVIYCLDLVDKTEPMQPLEENMFYKRLDRLDKSKVIIERRVIHNYTFKDNCHEYELEIVLTVNDEGAYAEIDFEEEEKYRKFLMLDFLTEKGAKN